jgi:nitrite reductase/ring-hydroxylating ferredoxin subunit
MAADRAPGGPSGDASLEFLGSYRRPLPVGLERVYENALDWARLPHVHRGDVVAIACHDVNARGWCAWLATADDELLVELVLDRRARRWQVRILGGRLAGAELRFQARVLGPDRVEIEVRAFVPRSRPLASLARQRFAELAARFWQADVLMMVERQYQIDRRIDTAGPVERERDLGRRDELSLPLQFALGGRDFLLAEVEGDLFAFPQRCPHQLGPLSDAPLAGRVLTCPWHGYRFDVRTGENLSGGVCRLSQLPIVRVTDGRVLVIATHGPSAT